MEIGIMLQLEHKQDEISEFVTYSCKIAEKNKHYLFMDYPVNEITRKTEFFP